MDKAHTSFPPEGHCLMGAMMCAMPHEAFIYDCEETENLQAIIREQFPDRISAGYSVPSFNDDEDTHIEDIIMVLEKAAIRLDENVE